MFKIQKRGFLSRGVIQPCRLQQWQLSQVQLNKNVREVIPLKVWLPQPLSGGIPRQRAGTEQAQTIPHCDSPNFWALSASVCFPWCNNPQWFPFHGLVQFPLQHPQSHPCDFTDPVRVILHHIHAHFTWMWSTHENPKAMLYHIFHLLHDVMIRLDFKLPSHECPSHQRNGTFQCLQCLQDWE